MEILYKRNRNEKDNFPKVLTKVVTLAGTAGSGYTYSSKRKLAI